MLSRHGSHSISHSDSTINLKFRYTPDMEVILSLVQIPITVRIHSRHGSHSATHTDLNFRYSPDMLQTRLPFCHSFRVYPQHTVAPYTDIPLSSRYNTDTLQDMEVILLFIQISYFRYSMDTPQTRRSFYYSFRLQQSDTD